MNLTPLLDIVFPRFCLTCGRGLLDSTRHFVCACCLARIDPLGLSACPVCAADLGPDAAISACRSCRSLRPKFTATVAVGKYSGLLKDLIPRLKYGREARVAWPLADLLAETLLLHHRVDEIEAVVPVPQSLKRRFVRGFNQAELIAEGVARRCRLPLVRTGLRRTAASPPQVSLSRTDRLRSPRHTMTGRDPRRTLAPVMTRLPPFLSDLIEPRLRGPIAGRVVLLVDDVITTGGTANEATRALLAAGAREVMVGAVARA